MFIVCDGFLAKAPVPLKDPWAIPPAFVVIVALPPVAVQARAPTLAVSVGFTLRDQARLTCEGNWYVPTAVLLNIITTTDRFVAEVML